MSSIERLKEGERYWLTFRKGFEHGAQTGFEEAIATSKRLVDSLRQATLDGASKEELKELLNEAEEFLGELRFVGIK